MALFTQEQKKAIQPKFELVRDKNIFRFIYMIDTLKGEYVSIMFKDNILNIVKFENDVQVKRLTFVVFSALEAFKIIKPYLKSIDVTGLFNVKYETDYKNHKHYQICYNAHRNTSFSPDKRALTACKTFDSELMHFAGCGANDKQLAKLENLFIDWQYKKSKCLSFMITGPANFPVRRNEKANNAEHKASEAYYGYNNHIINKIKHEKFKSENPDLIPIRNDDENAKEKLQAKLEKQKAEHEKMKQANRLARMNDKQGLIDLLGNASEKTLNDTEAPFKGFYLQNSLAEIKRLEDRLKTLDKIETIGTKEISLNDNTKIVQCSETKRIFIEFDGKPNADIRTLLKSNGFKWTPSKNHWGRVLTDNAVYATQNRVLPKLQKQRV